MVSDRSGLDPCLVSGAVVQVHGSPDALAHRVVTPF